MNNKKLMMGEVTLNVADFTTTEIEKFQLLFGSNIQAKLVIVDAQGMEHEIEVGEILNSDIKAFDPIDGYEIHHESELLPH